VRGPAERKGKVKMIDIQSRLQIHHEEPFKIELARGQKGSYGWTITVHAITAEEALSQVTSLDAKLKAQFNGENPVDA